MSDEISVFPELTIAQQVSNYIACNIDIGTLYTSAGMYLYGSSVYGYKNPSDTDVIAVFEGTNDYCEQFTITNINDDSEIDITLYSRSSFLNKVNEHNIGVLECVFANKDNILVPLSPLLQNDLATFTIDKANLRASISKTASNSYVKAKKKLIVEEDFDLVCSLKSLWHSLRILDFGTQLAEDGVILDFTSCNWMFKEILNLYTTSDCNWDEIHKEYKPIYNEMSSAFKEVCPKN